MKLNQRLFRLRPGVVGSWFGMPGAVDTMMMVIPPTPVPKPTPHRGMLVQPPLLRTLQTQTGHVTRPAGHTVTPPFTEVIRAAK